MDGGEAKDDSEVYSGGYEEENNQSSGQEFPCNSEWSDSRYCREPGSAYNGRSVNAGGRDASYKRYDQNAANGYYTKDDHYSGSNKWAGTNHSTGQFRQQKEKKGGHNFASGHHDSQFVDDQGIHGGKDFGNIQGQGLPSKGTNNKGLYTKGKNKKGGSAANISANVNGVGIMSQHNSRTSTNSISRNNVTSGGKDGINKYAGAKENNRKVSGKQAARHHEENDPYIITSSNQCSNSNQNTIEVSDHSNSGCQVPSRSKESLTSADESDVRQAPPRQSPPAPPPPPPRSAEAETFEIVPGTRWPENPANVVRKASKDAAETSTKLPPPKSSVPEQPSAPPPPPSQESVRKPESSLPPRPPPPPQDLSTSAGSFSLFTYADAAKKLQKEKEKSAKDTAVIAGQGIATIHILDCLSSYRQASFSRR